MKSRVQPVGLALLAALLIGGGMLTMPAHAGVLTLATPAGASTAVDPMRTGTLDRQQPVTATVGAASIYLPLLQTNASAESATLVTPAPATEAAGNEPDDGWRVHLPLVGAGDGGVSVAAPEEIAVPQAIGGPDAFGYVYTDSLTTPALYNWVDIAGSGEQVGFGDADSDVAGLALPESFAFYDRTYTNLYVTTNGYASFRSVQAADVVDQCDAAQRQPPEALPAYCADLRDGAVYYQTTTAYNGHQSFVVQYDGVTHVATGAPVTFQIILDLEDQAIIYQYRTLPAGSDDAVSAIIGYAANRADYLSYCQGAGCPAQTGLAVRFALPPRPRLAASLLPSSDFPDVGNVVTYTLVMSNPGSAPANGAVMTNALPAGMTYVAGSVSATAGVASYVEGDRTVRWAGDLPVDAPVTLIYAAQIDSAEPLYNSVVLAHRDAVQPAGATSTPADRWADPVAVDVGRGFSSPQNLGSWRHIAVDGQGRPHVAYAGDGLYYAIQNEGVWSVDVVTTTASQKPALLLDDAGSARIVFLSGSRLWLARQSAARASATWAIDPITAVASSWQVGHLDLQQGSDGRLHLVYVYANELYYTVYDGAAWSAPVRVLDTNACNLDPNSSNYGFALALDAADVPHVACVQNSTFPKQVRLYTYSATAPWTIYEVVAEHNSYCSFPSLVYDGAAPLIAYFGSNYAVYQAEKNGAAWETHLVDQLHSPYMQVSAILDVRDGWAGMGYAFYAGTSPYTLTVRAAVRSLSSAEWTTATVDTHSLSTWPASNRATMALGAGGRVHLAYYYAPDETLRHAVADQSIATDTVDQSREFGATAIKLGPDESVHVTYLSGGLRYAHAPAGTDAWTSTLVDPGAPRDWTATLALAVDAGNIPHIAYTGDNAPIYHATLNGSTWITRQVAAHTYLPNSDLALGAGSAGVAHLAYMDVEGDNQVVRHAAFAAGAWTVETLAIASPNPGGIAQSPQIAVVGDRVYILYADCTGFQFSGDYPVELMLATWDGGWTSRSVYAFSGQCAPGGLAYQLLVDDAGRLAMAAAIDSDSVRPSPLNVFQWLTESGVAVETAGAPRQDVPAPVQTMGRTSSILYTLRGDGYESVWVDYLTKIKLAYYTDGSGNQTPQIPVGVTTGSSTYIVGSDRRGSAAAVIESTYGPSGLYVETVIRRNQPRCCLRTTAQPTGGGVTTPGYSEGACGVAVDVSATANAGWVFKNWSGAASGSSAATTALRSGRVPDCSTAVATFELEPVATAGKTATPAAPTQVYPEADIRYQINLSWLGPRDAVIAVSDPYPWPRVTFNGNLTHGPYIAQCQHNEGTHTVSCSGQFPASETALTTQAAFTVKTTCDLYTTQGQSGAVRNTSSVQIDGFNFTSAATTAVKVPFRLKASTPKFVPQVDFERGHNVLLYTVPKGDEPTCCTACALDVYVVVDGDVANPRKMTNDGAGLANRAQADFFANDCHHSLWVEPTENRAYRLDLYVVKQGDPFQPLYLADTLTLEPTREPNTAVYTDLRELFKEFHETTPNSPSQDLDGNCIRDYYDALARIVRYAEAHDGVVLDVRQDAYNADHDYYANFATRQTMGREIDENLTKKLEGLVMSLFNIAVIGDDAVLPFYRVPAPAGGFDETTYLRGNADNNPTVLDTQNAGGGAANGHLMSDLPYATYESTLPDYPRPSISIGRIFYLTPAALAAGIDGYETAVDVRAAQSRASAVCLDNEPELLWDTIFNRAIRPVLRSHYGAGVQATVPYTGPLAFENGKAYLYRGAITPWNAITSTQKAVQNTQIMLFYSHANQYVWSSEAARLLANGSLDPRVQGARDIDLRDLANAGLRVAISTGCHSGYSTAYRQTDAGHPLYRRSIVRAMLDEQVAYYAPTVYGYGANDVTSHHDMLIREFLKGVFHRTYGSIGDAYYIALRHYTATGDAGRDKYVLYSMHLYGLPTQPLRHAAAALQSRSVSQVALRQALPTAAVALSETIVLPHFAVAFDAAGAAVFDIPQQGGRSGASDGPILPAVVRTHALPAGATNLAVTLAGAETHLHPQPVTMQTMTPINLSFGPQRGVFTQTGLYPSSVLRHRVITDVGVTLLEVTATPLQYNLDNRQVTLYDRVTYQISYQAPATATIAALQVNGGQPVAVGTAAVAVDGTLDSAIPITGDLLWAIEDGAGLPVDNGVAALDVAAGVTVLGWSVDARAWSPGPKSLWVAARDGDGRVLAVGQATFQATGLWLTAHASAPFYTETSGAASIAAYVRDENGGGVSGQAARLTLRIDGQASGAPWVSGADGLYTAAPTLAALPAGQHSFEVDLEGLSESGGFVVDRAAPTSTLTLSPTVTANQVWVAFDWRDDAGATSVYTAEVQVDNGAWQVWQVVALDYNAPTGASFGPDDPVVVDLAKHVYCFRSQAQDLAGHVEPQHASADACTAPATRTLYLPILQRGAP